MSRHQDVTKDEREELRRQVTFIVVDDAEEVLRHALISSTAAVRPGAG
jgi:hypothetical protein